MVEGNQVIPDYGLNCFVAFSTSALRFTVRYVLPVIQGVTIHRSVVQGVTLCRLAVRFAVRRYVSAVRSSRFTVSCPACLAACGRRLTTAEGRLGSFHPLGVDVSAKGGNGQTFCASRKSQKTRCAQLTPRHKRHTGDNLISAT